MPKYLNTIDFSPEIQTKVNWTSFSNSLFHRYFPGFTMYRENLIGTLNGRYMENSF